VLVAWAWDILSTFGASSLVVRRAADDIAASHAGCLQQSEVWRGVLGAPPPPDARSLLATPLQVLLERLVAAGHLAPSQVAPAVRLAAALQVPANARGTFSAALLVAMWERRQGQGGGAEQGRVGERRGAGSLAESAAAAVVQAGFPASYLYAVEKWRRKLLLRCQVGRLCMQTNKARSCAACLPPVMQFGKRGLKLPCMQRRLTDQDIHQN
jgi:hypothetical protein